MQMLTGLALLLALAGPTVAAEPEENAQKSAEAWLSLVDSGQFGESWDRAAELFRGAITREDWKKALSGTRSPLGKLLRRTLKSRTYAESLPGAPDGKYVVIQYETTFENKTEAVETVTPMLDPDGNWRVSGYFIK